MTDPGPLEQAVLDWSEARRARAREALAELLELVEAAAEAAEEAGIDAEPHRALAAEIEEDLAELREGD